MKMIYGEFVSARAHAPVTISQLGREGCELVIAAPSALFNTLANALADGDVALWIGAIGPLAITALHGATRRNRHLVARFAQPLEPAILAHFDG